MVFPDRIEGTVEGTMTDHGFTPTYATARTARWQPR